MPRGKKPEKAAFKGVEFVACNLTPKDRKDFATWCSAEADNFDDHLREIMQSGHKITLSFSEYSDSFIASVTGKPEDCINAGRCYTSHAKDYTQALWVALFKFHVIWKRGVWESIDNEEDYG